AERRCCVGVGGGEKEDAWRGEIAVIEQIITAPDQRIDLTFIEFDGGVGDAQWSGLSRSGRGRRIGVAWPRRRVGHGRRWGLPDIGLAGIRGPEASGLLPPVRRRGLWFRVLA